MDLWEGSSKAVSIPVLPFVLPGFPFGLDDFNVLLLLLRTLHLFL